MIIQAVGAFAVSWFITQETTRMCLIGQLQGELQYFILFGVVLVPMLFFGWITTLFCILGMAIAYLGVYKL